MKTKLHRIDQAQSAIEVSPKRVKYRRRGSTLVEFALVVPVLLALLIGIMEFGWLVKNSLQIANAAREGARAGSLGATTTAITTAVQKRSSPLTVTISIDNSTDGQVYSPVGNNTANTANNAAPGALVRVTVRSRLRPLTGFFPFLRNRDIVEQAQFGRE